jgi:hypothetical protein
VTGVDQALAHKEKNREAQMTPDDRDREGKISSRIS